MRPARPWPTVGAMRLHRLLPVPVCLLALAAPAAAKPVKYQLTVNGSQVTTWDYVKKQQPTCDWPESEGGRQAIEFGTQGGAKTTITMNVTRRGALQLAPGMVSLPAKGTQRRTYRRLFAQQGPCPGGGTYGGGEGPPRNAIGTAQCKVGGKVDFRMGGTVQSVFDKADPVRPPTALRAPAGFLIARADPHWSEAVGSSERSLPARCAATGQGDADIGITDGEREWSGSVIESKTRLALKKVKKLRRGKRLKFSLRRRTSYPSSTHPTPGNPTTKGKTVLDVDVSLKRLSR